MRQVFELARERDQIITVPADVVAEWWRGPTDVRKAILDSVDVEPLTLGLAKTVGQALGAVPGASLVDAIVVASAEVWTGRGREHRLGDDSKGHRARCFMLDQR